MDDVRQAVITAHKLHIKWTVRRGATPVSWYTFPGRFGEIGEQSQTLLIDDGIHVVHFDTDYTLKLRRIDTGQIVWQLRSTPLEELGGFGCTTHEGVIILIFQRTTKSYNTPVLYYGRMEI